LYVLGITVIFHALQEKYFEIKLSSPYVGTTSKKINIFYLFYFSAAPGLELGASDLLRQVLLPLEPLDKPFFCDFFFF
jgi:hypothetical protein